MEYTLGLPPFRRGGLPQYSKELSETLSKSHNVTLVYPGHMQFFSRLVKFNLLKTKTPYKVYELINPMPVSLGLGIKNPEAFYTPRNSKYMKQFLTENKFDVIHLHTLMGLPLEFLQLANKMGIKLVYTTHDFYGLCPKILGEKPVEHLMNTKCSPDCMICPNGPSLIKLYVMQSKTYMRLKNSGPIKILRKEQKDKLDIDNRKITRAGAENKYKLLQYYKAMFNLIDKFHFNSSVSKMIFMKYFPKINGEIINITREKLNRSTCSKHGPRGKIIFSYVGPYDYKKGFFSLEKILTKLREKYNNFEVHLCGDNRSNLTFLKHNWVKNYGILDTSQMNQFYDGTDILIMPSIWHETFGFAVLEALCNGAICIASKNVGSADLLPNNLVFDSENDFLKKVESFLKNPSLITSELQTISCLDLPIDFNLHVNKIVRDIYC